MKFSYDRAWADGIAMVRGHVEILLVLAGMFLMLPDFAREIFIPAPQIATFDAATVAIVEAYFRENAVALFLLNLPTLLGSAAILALLADPRRPTVGEALRVALVMLPSIFVLNWLVQTSIFVGLLLFVLPGVYLLGRFAIAGAWQMATRSMNPLAAIEASFRATRGVVWRVAGLVLLVFATTFIATRAAAIVLGILLTLVLPVSAFAVTAALLSAILTAAMWLVLLLLAAAIYRQLGAPITGT